MEDSNPWTDAQGGIGVGSTGVPAQQLPVSEKTDSPLTRKTENVDSSIKNDPITPKEDKPTTPGSLSKKVQDLTNSALHFLATAPNETVGAVVIGLCATTYIILGRVGLVLIGTVGGVVLHASWDGSSGSVHDAEIKAVEIRRKREVGLDVAKRVLEWRERRNETAGDDGKNDVLEDADVALSSRKELDYSEFRPETAAALTDLTDAVVRDYVQWWYDPIRSAETTFPFACRQTLTRFIISVSNHLSRKRPADTFLDFLTNSSSIAIVFLNELSAALMAPSSIGLSPAESIDKYLVDEPESSLANVLSLKQQEKKLELVAEDILQTFLDAKSYNCEPVKVFLREILAGVVLDMTVNSCSKPEFINGWIIYLLEDPEPGLMEAIDAGIEGTDKQFRESKAKIEATTKEKSTVAPTEVSPIQSQQEAKEDKRLSIAEDPMEEAKLEAERLTAMIKQEEEARKMKETQMTESIGTLSTATTDGLATPTSSDGDANAQADSTATTITSPTFTSFDQLSNVGTESSPLPSPTSEAAILTLYNANVSIFDDSVPGEKGTIRSKPTNDLLLQIEPSSARFPGWMIARKYADFETLHEVLRRIAQVSGVSDFTDKHATLPTWKGQTKQYLSQNLERYLQSALRYERLAESEGMKRFLEKDQGLGKKSTGFGFPSPAAFENVGKGMLDVLTAAPKGVAGGGKAVFDGVTGVFGGQKKPVSNTGTPKSKTPSTTGFRRTDSVSSVTSAQGKSRDSIDSVSRSLAVDRRQSSDTSFAISTVPEENVPPLPARPTDRASLREERPRSASSTTTTSGIRDALASEPDVSARTSLSGSRSSLMQQREELHLPPPPSDIPDDYTEPSALNGRRASILERVDTRESTPAAPPTPPRPTTTNSISSPSKPATKPKDYEPLSVPETRMTIELIFALINELYTLSSAWNIRKTLLNAAKSYLLRSTPGTTSNPSLDAIRSLLQDTIITANITDTGIAAHIAKIRTNALPTEAELKEWPAPLAGDELEAQRVKARKLLVERGMPAALMSVMGAAASGEALGRVFDALQVDTVARGFMFAIILQAIRAATQ